MQIGLKQTHTVLVTWSTASPSGLAMLQVTLEVTSDKKLQFTTTTEELQLPRRSDVSLVLLSGSTVRTHNPSLLRFNGRYLCWSSGSSSTDSHNNQG